MDITKLDLKNLDGLSPAERKLALSILKEYSTNGQSQILDKLVSEDYDEIPVVIEEFLHNPLYLGNGLVNDEGRFTVFPYWVDVLKDVFPDSYTTRYNTLVLSGAIGLGKSFVAVICMLYLLYRMLCLKDPYKHYGLQPIDHITFSIMNITLDAAKGVAWAKLQELVQLSPWFMAHGRMSKSQVNPEWQPNKNIELIYGSQPRHVIGRAVYCLSGDTQILTEKGFRELESLVNTPIRVYNANGELSDLCTVQPTIKTNKFISIELEDGTVIKCTPNHRFMTKEGVYKAAADLTDEDELADTNFYGYVYKTTNLVNGKIYVGQKHSNVFLGEKYLGSGFKLLKAIRKYGKENFKVELLDWAFSREELDIKEKEYISFWMCTDRNIGYNIADGGQGGNLGPEAIAKMKYSLRHNGNTSLGKICITDGHINRFIKPEEPIPEGWCVGSKTKGSKKSKETILRMKRAQSQRVNIVYGKNKNKQAITNGSVTRFINPTETPPAGWTFGNINTRGKHDCSHWTLEMHQNRSRLSSGSNNWMYGKGYLRVGGLNTNSHKWYRYKDHRFECRKELLQFFEKNNIKIPGCVIRDLENNRLSNLRYEKYKEFLKDLSWGWKNEN